MKGSRSPQTNNPRPGHRLSILPSFHPTRLPCEQHTYNAEGPFRTIASQGEGLRIHKGVFLLVGFLSTVGFLFFRLDNALLSLAGWRLKLEETFTQLKNRVAQSIRSQTSLPE